MDEISRLDYIKELGDMIWYAIKSMFGKSDEKNESS